ncbi:hypothetical protein EYF80_056761 [Liparis tanakae]|uniref:Uncharacterized protein n=1 Tax=Liparis tanakae TaxID=230148 RepID=A0A4Z2EWW8_9TELE|nr:hypothetical protein EYF80_056761 [Liparis tanakae]
MARLNESSSSQKEAGRTTDGPIRRRDEPPTDQSGGGRPSRPHAEGPVVPRLKELGKEPCVTRPPCCFSRL